MPHSVTPALDIHEAEALAKVAEMWLGYALSEKIKIPHGQNILTSAIRKLREAMESA